MNEVITDCRTEEGKIIGLIDSIIFIARVLAEKDLSSAAVQSALMDFRNDEDIQRLISIQEIQPHWEVVIDKDTEGSNDEFYRVRWSKPTANGFWYAAHYGGNGSSMNKSMAESTAERWNDEKKLPFI
ncbi:MAG: hypothetical protein K1X72_04470 [Pyrinomonadaceae bacterium]|nr:hypothetical protein [Pyrinomonadaceae bacterium]